MGTVLHKLPNQKKKKWHHCILSLHKFNPYISLGILIPSHLEQSSTSQLLLLNHVLDQYRGVAVLMRVVVLPPPEAILWQHQNVVDELCPRQSRQLVAGELLARRAVKVVHERIRKGHLARRLRHSVGRDVFHVGPLLQVLGYLIDERLDGWVARLGQHGILAEMHHARLCAFTVGILGPDDEVSRAVELGRDPVRHGLVRLGVEVGPGASLTEHDEVPQVVGLHDPALDLGEDIGDGRVKVVAHVIIVAASVEGDALVAPSRVLGPPRLCVLPRLVAGAGAF